ncbi:TIGR04222 domain-containing membrane protein [[Kitasatospora] papulosa]|uniref:TIGR04222 domain-containing membrane protein n=1 Tax=[Kitasatospora] papulosa TaxID=1464011 RepID=UPI0036962C27
MNTLALVVTLVVAVCSVLQLATRRTGARNAGGTAYVHDLSEVAFLCGGPARVVDTALTRMHMDGRLAIGGPGIVAVQREEAHDAVERAVLHDLAAARNGSLSRLREDVMRHPAVQEIGDGLAARGLLAAPGESRARRARGLVLGIGCAVGFPVSIALTVAQYATHDAYADIPLPFFLKVLPALVAGTVIGLVTAAAAKVRLTTSGRAAVDAHRTANAQVTDPAHLVATRGLGALPDPGLQGQLVTAARQRPARRTPSASSPSASSGAVFVPVTWCAGVGPGGGGCGGSSGGGGDSGTGSACSSGSSCGGGGGSSCGGSS